jgi:hypothetical protein
VGQNAEFYCVKADCTYRTTWLYSRAIAQAASRLFPAAVARVLVHVRSCEVCGGQSGSGAAFLLVLRFPLPIFIPPTAPHC